MVQNFYNWLRHYFAFSHAEMRGVLVLLFIIQLLLLSPFFYRPWLASEYQALGQDQALLDSLIVQVEHQLKTSSGNLQSPARLAAFDPNLADRQTLLELGIPQHIADRIIHYREKGGKFRQKKDLLKIYGFPADTYQKLEAYIGLPETVSTERKPQRKIIARFDINQADSLQLMQLKGIGSVLSARIIKFRDILGGFHSLTQLSEVYGIGEPALKELEKYAFVAPGFAPRKININAVGLKELMRHPYISYDMAKAIVNHRKNYGTFAAVEDLQEVSMIDAALLKKLSPYVGL